MDTLSAFLMDIGSLGLITDCVDLELERENFSVFARRLEDALNSVDEEILNRIGDCFDSSILDVQYTPISLLLLRFEGCLKEFGKLDNWCHFRSLLKKLENAQVLSYIDTATSRKIEPEYIVGAFQKLFYFQWIDSILSASPVLSEFNRVSQDSAVGRFVEKDKEQLDINKALIREKLSAMRPSADIIAQGSPIAKILREGEKKRKQKSIRTLLAETGEIVQVLKPCFLMSPLSVSTFLAPGAVEFDVVVFDEASQIFPQDAIGAIYRAKQLIVVGDSKQMPPSNFFNSTLEVEDDEDADDVTDFESILDICSTCMQQLRLCWHYRSRYEQLIAFSNKNFYDNTLITFPSAKKDAPGIGVDYFNVEGGVFDRKSHTNRIEAEYVVDLVYANIEKYPNRSLGVVAFSKNQQDLIDRLLSRRRQQTPEYEEFFTLDKEEPFFVKNLETVQGDERDAIIFSVAYCKDSQGRLLHNFGPLNRAGGERRLNVAVTRAKSNVQLVSSMHYSDIDLKRTSSEGARLLREYLDYAENGNIALERSISVNPYEHYDSEFELEVADFLRSKGFAVDTQVGCSGFRIDLGLKLPNTSEYILAIECDGATYHSSKNARDRDRLRQEILERMGWTFYRIWSTDWFRNNDVEKKRLLTTVKNIMEGAIESKSNPNSPETAEETFDLVAEDDQFGFPAYKSANVGELMVTYYGKRDLKGLVKAILDIESPLSEELLLKRIVGWFDREKVTNVVKDEYKKQMLGYRQYEIKKRGGFLYLDDGREISFRSQGDIKREIKHIAPEELAAGMREILKQNISAERDGLYRALAAQCGISRITKSARECLDNALELLKDEINIEDDLITIKDVRQ
jgi:very-short-patch-repair endonuclease